MLHIKQTATDGLQSRVPFDLIDHLEPDGLSALSLRVFCSRADFTRFGDWFIKAVTK